MDIIIKLVLLLILIVVNAYFAMSEIAIISLNDNLMEKMAEDGNKKAKQIVKLTSNASNFLSTIQIGVTLAGFMTSASASQSFATMLTDWIMKLGVSPSYEGLVNSVSVIIITIIISYFSLVLGELAPKRMAMQKPEKIAFLIVGSLSAFAKVARPFVRFLSFSTNVVVKLFGFDPNIDEENVTEEEIRMMVDVGQEKGVIEDMQKEMINNIFEFDDINVADIMTHRTDMVAVEDTDTLETAVELSIKYGFSRLPVFHEDQDDIIGIIYIKDLLRYIDNELPKDKGPAEIMRPAYYVPTTKNCGDLFAEMTEKRTQFAVVVDEYGGTAGIVTLEDLIESIVGNIQDEYDQEDEDIVAMNENLFTVDGTTPIEEVNELVNDIIPDGDYETIGGFVISLLGYLPQNGKNDEVDFENLHFTVLNVEERRIGKIRIEITPVQKQEEEI
ncbi:MAG: HlyC/CorC family transporter [Ruminococcaceae bacterium]|nr:HlyC/CorC family transporter [Oscillospiraceae bacterium]